MPWPRPHDASPPCTEEELLARAHALAGLPLEHLARASRIPVPETLERAKGFVGHLVERALGGDGSNRPEPDFAALGVEVKSLPVDARGRSRESTYLGRVELSPARDLTWETSALRRKIARVLFVPVEAERHVPIGARRVGTPFLWSPDAAQEAQLRSDYEELVSIIAAGFIDSISARRGKWLQIRPKASSARDRGRGVDDEGGLMRTLPRGFYLRSAFTSALIARHFGLEARNTAPLRRR